MKRINVLSMTAACLVMVACATPEQKEAKLALKEAERAVKIAASEEKIPDGYTRLTGDKLTEFVSDSTVSGLSERATGWSYVVYRAPNGKQRGISKSGGVTATDSGKWSIIGDTYCSKWNRWVDGKKTCYHV